MAKLYVYHRGHGPTVVDYAPMRWPSYGQFVRKEPYRDGSGDMIETGIEVRFVFEMPTAILFHVPGSVDPAYIPLN